MTTVHIVSHVGDDHKEYDNEEGEKFYRTSHSGGLKATNTAFSYIKGGGLQMNCLDATIILLQRQERGVETETHFPFLENMIPSPTLSLY